MSITFEDIVAARQRIAGNIYVSPCPRSMALSGISRCSVFCKLDFLQQTGSFKERGACNALLELSPEQRRHGAVAASAGNHALGLAYHGKLLKTPVTVVMPEFAPLIKRTTCGQLGARVVLHGETFGESLAHARELSEREGFTFIHAFNDPAVIAGQGTLGLEIVEQVPDLDAVVVPVGGGGLIAGIGLTVKTLRPNAKVIGVEPERAACLAAAMEAGRPVPVTVRPTLADGLAVSEVGSHTFALARRHVDRVVAVNEDEIALAILRLVEMEKAVVEGAGATPLAAVMSGKLPELEGKKVVLVFAGGNIDPIILSRVIEKGLVADGRLCRFTAVVSDRPGGLARFASLVASTGASIHEVSHDRAFAGGDVSATNVICTLETSDHEHIRRVCRVLAENGIVVKGEASGE